MKKTFYQGGGITGIQQHFNPPKGIVAGGGGSVSPVLQGFHGRPRISLRFGGGVFLVPAAGGPTRSPAVQNYRTLHSSADRPHGKGGAAQCTQGILRTGTGSIINY